jgi:hypothetical protein
MKATPRGAALIELALILAVMAPIVVGGAQFGYAFYLIHQLEDAVGDAAEFASKSEYRSPEEFRIAVQDRALSHQIPGLQPEHIRVSLEPDSTGRQRWVSVAIQGYEVRTPFAVRRLDGRPRASLPYLLPLP